MLTAYVFQAAIRWRQAVSSKREYRAILYLRYAGAPPRTAIEFELHPAQSRRSIDAIVRW